MSLKALWSRLESCDRRVSRLNTARALATQQRRALSTVTEWKWATGEMLELNPFVRHILRLPRDRWLTKGKPQPFKHVEHGLDRDGRIVCMRRRERFPAGTRVDEDYVVYERDLVTIARYGDVTGLTQRHLERWMSATYADGSLTHYVDLHPDFLLIEEFVRQSGQIASSVELRRRRGFKAYGLGPPTGPVEASRCTYRYGALGDLIAISVRMAKFPSGAAVGRSRNLWQRAPRNVTLKSALADVRARLIDAMLRAAAASQIREPAYCLLIVYDLENPEFPPTIAFGLESERRASRQRNGPDAVYHIWNPVELQWHRRPESEFKDPALLRSCRILNELLRDANACRILRDTLNGIAQELNQRDWSRTLKVTDDFAVIAVDLELQGDLGRNARKALPRQRLRKLERAGWL